MSDFKMNMHGVDKITGRVIDGIYITHRKPEHFMRKYQGFGVSKEILDKLEKDGVNTIMIVYHGIKAVITREFNLKTYLNSTMTYNYQDKDMQHFVKFKDGVLVDE